MRGGRKIAGLYMRARTAGGSVGGGAVLSLKVRRRGDLTEIRGVCYNMRRLDKQCLRYGAAACVVREGD